jgi:hypothetical protein
MAGGVGAFFQVTFDNLTKEVARFDGFGRHGGFAGGLGGREGTHGDDFSRPPPAERKKAHPCEVRLFLRWQLMLPVDGKGD